MAMGRRRRRPKQTSMWVATQDLARNAAHPFYARLNQIFEKADFDGYVEARWQRFYADEIGRPSLAPGRYVRLLLIGYFEGLDAERAIAWRAADSLALRQFFGLVLPEAPPEHSTISRTRRLIDLETHEAVFTSVLRNSSDHERCTHVTPRSGINNSTRHYDILPALLEARHFRDELPDVDVDPFRHVALPNSINVEQGSVGGALRLADVDSSHRAATEYQIHARVSQDDLSSDHDAFPGCGRSEQRQNEQGSEHDSVPR
jgi:hypothetical protein